MKTFIRVSDRSRRVKGEGVMMKYVPVVKILQNKLKVQQVRAKQ